MTRSLQQSRALLLASLPGLLTVFLGGCATQKTRVVPPAQLRPAQTATKAQLLDAYNTQARAMQSLNATVDLHLTAGSSYSGVIHDYHDAHGFILAGRPSSIRVIGQAPVIGKNIFDMVSDGSTFRIFIPSKSQFLVGCAEISHPSSKPAENLRPQHVLDAFFWPEISPESLVLIEEFDADPNRYYVLTVLRHVGDSSGAAGELEVARKIWFDRADLAIARLQIYGPAGRLDSDISYSDWGPVGAVQPGADAPTETGTATPIVFARDVRITRPQEDYQLEIEITKLALNSTIPADRFDLKQPEGSQVVRVGDDTCGTEP